MQEIIFSGLALNGAYALLSILSVWMMLRMLDNLSNVEFHLVINALLKDEKATALYFGLRFVGACLLFGLVVQ